MTTANSRNDLYEFGPFRLDAAEHTLLRHGEAISLTPKAFETLLVFVRNGGRLIPKDELLKTVWPDTIVEENNITQNISMLRKALGQQENGQPYIETVPRCGYRFVATVVTPVAVPVPVVDAPEKPADPAAVTPRAVRPLLHRVVPAAVAVMAIILYIGNIWTFERPRKPKADSTVKSIAILPFLSINGGEAEYYLGAGMADALITQLSKLNGIVVRPTTAVLKYAAPGRNPVAAAKEMSAELVVDGKVQQAGNRIRVTAQLINVSDGATVWSEKFEEDFTEIFSVEDSISQQMARALVPGFSRDAKNRLTRHGTENVEAYRLYLQGRYHLSRFTEQEGRQAIACFNQAIERDSNYALAYVGLADSYYLLANLYEDSKEAMERAKAAALHAIALDDLLAEAHSSLALVRRDYDWDWDEAEREHKRAIELNPGYAFGHEQYGMFLASMARFDESLAQLRRAHEIDPQSPEINAFIGLPYYLARQYDEAVEQYRKTLQLHPQFWVAHWMIGLALDQKNETAKAMEAFESARKLDDNGWVMAGLGRSLAVAGRKAEARRLLQQWTDPAKHKTVSPYFAATVYAALGDKEEALAHLEKAYELRDEWMMWLKVEPRFDSLRLDPRFAALQRRMGLSN